MKRLLLFSGGIESIALAFMERPELLLFVDYGQAPARGERRAARTAAGSLGIEFFEVKVDCLSIGSGDLAGAPASGLATTSDWWPFRNQLLVTVAATFAVGQNVNEILIGTVVGDEIFKDGSSEFVSQMSALLAVQEGGLGLEAPAIEWTTSELIRRSCVPLSLLAWAHSCHVNEWGCGFCRGCQKRRVVLEVLFRPPPDESMRGDVGGF